MEFIYQWADALWLIIAVFFLPRDQRLVASGFVAACMVMMRLLAELMGAIGYPAGMLGLLHSDLYLRGLVTYGVFIGLYMVLARFSREPQIFIQLAAALSLFFLASFVFVAIMVL